MIAPCRASRGAASVAQLDRVLPSEGRGRGFESRRMRHLPPRFALRTKHPQARQTERAFLCLSLRPDQCPRKTAETKRPRMSEARPLPGLLSSQPGGKNLAEPFRQEKSRLAAGRRVRNGVARAEGAVRRPGLFPRRRLKIGSPHWGGPSLILRVVSPDASRQRGG